MEWFQKLGGILYKVLDPSMFDLQLSVNYTTASWPFNPPRHGAKRKSENLQRDLRILKLYELNDLSFGEIALKVYKDQSKDKAARSAYARMKKDREERYAVYLKLKKYGAQLGLMLEEEAQGTLSTKPTPIPVEPASGN